MAGANIEAKWLIERLGELIPPGSHTITDAGHTMVSVPLLLVIGARGRMAEDQETIRAHAELKAVIEAMYCRWCDHD